MNVLDLVTATYAAVSAGRGAKNGVSQEGYRLVRLAVSFLAGCGLFTLINQTVAGLLDSVLDHTKGIGFAAGLAFVFYAMRRLKTAIIAYLEKRFAEKYNRLGGAIAGLFKALTAITALIAFMQMSPWIPGNKTASQSLIGRVVNVFTPHPEAPQQENKP